MRPLLALFIGILSINSIASQTNFHDRWTDPVVLCNNNDFLWQNFAPVQTEYSNDFKSCVKPFENLSIVWFRFQIQNESSLAFTIVPLQNGDDIDFVLFKSDRGIPQEIIRCMATGVLMDRDVNAQPQCTGQTGLIQSESDFSEPTGCSSFQNNFLKPVTVSPDEEYFILVTNFRSDKGFLLQWNGNTLLKEDDCLLPKEKTFELSISPNPARDIIHCNILSQHDGAGNLRIVNKQGLVVENRNLQLRRGKNEVGISLASLSSGDYFLSMVFEGNHVMRKFEVIK